jgi:crotonobetainyl-CoA:carnitine CoA-transferase CaiB-like acyl-CoA transferase
VRRSDIVVENFSPAGAEIMGLSYESMKAANPAIIVASMRAFASGSVYRERLGFDPIAQAMSGGMFQTGFPGNPPTRSTVRYVDYSTGMSAAYGAVAALYRREKTGNGQQLEVSLLDTAVVMNGGTLAEYAVLGVERPPIGNRGYNIGPCDLYKAQDGWVYLVVAGNSTFKRFLRLVGREELFGDPRFGDDTLRFEHGDILDPLAANWVAERTVEQALAGLIAARIPCAPVYDSPHVLNDPYVQERRLLVDVDFPQVGRVPVPGMHVRMDGAEKVRLASPMLGSANRDIYQGLLQYTDDRLSELKDQGII